MAEKIRQKDMRRRQESQRECDRLRRQEAQQRQEEAARAVGSRCPAIFSDPHIQGYATKAASELGGDRYPLTSLSLGGLLNAFAFKVLDQIYPPSQVTINPFLEAAKSASLVTWTDCFPQFAKVLAEYQQKVQDLERARAAAAAEAIKPVNRLLAGYKRYVFVKFCNEVRQGYQMVYVNDIELGRARVAIKAIEDDVAQASPGLSTDEIWKQANAETGGEYATQGMCQIKLNELLQQAAAIHPDSVAPKDF